MAKQQVSQLAEGVHVVVTQNKNPSSVLFEIDNQQMATLNFTLDIAGSKNLALSDGKTESFTVIPAMSKKQIGKAAPIDSSAPWSLTPKFRWTESDPDPEVVEAATQESNNAIARELEIGKREKFDSDALTIAEIFAKCESLKTKFVDVEFPPTDKAINGTSGTKTKAVQWRRAQDFLGKDMQLFDQGIEPNDISQGELGDCWLMCAFSAIAEFPAEVKRLFNLQTQSKASTTTTTTQTANTTGVYEVRLCKNGEWQSIRIDDYFPCKFNGGTIFAKAHGNELWVMLLEKAFAKSCGHFDALKAGWAYEALMDLTGAPTTKVSFEDERAKEDMQTDARGNCVFWDFLVCMDKANNLITCSTPGEDKWSEGGGVPLDGPGLVSGHAYTLIKACKLSTGQRLLQLRNPWGSFEWSGKWSDNSPDWTPALRAEVGDEHRDVNANDGKFWMSYEDFIIYFNGVNVCRIFAESTKRGEAAVRWTEHRENGRFTFLNDKLVVAAYELNVPKTTKAWVSIHQQDSRDITAQPYVDMGLTVLKSDRKTLVASSGIDVDRQVQLEVQLTPGTYYVVPYTTGCKFQILAQSDDNNHSNEALFVNGELTAKASVAIRELHSRYDVELDRLLDRFEFTTLIKELTGRDISEAEFARILQRDDSVNNRVTPDGLVDYFTQLAATPSGLTTLKKALRNAGYDEHLKLCRARKFVFSIHSTCDVRVKRIVADAALLEEAIERPITALGRKKEYDEGKIAVYELRSGYNGVSLAVHNLHNASVEITIDCLGLNVVSSRGNLRATKIIRQGEVEVLHHLMPITESPWSWGYGIEWKRLPRQREIFL